MRGPGMCASNAAANFKGLKVMPLQPAPQPPGLGSVDVILLTQFLEQQLPLVSEPKGACAGEAARTSWAAETALKGVPSSPTVSLLMAAGVSPCTPPRLAAPAAVSSRAICVPRLSGSEFQVLGYCTLQHTHLDPKALLLLVPCGRDAVGH